MAQDPKALTRSPGCRHGIVTCDDPFHAHRSLHEARLCAAHEARLAAARAAAAAESAALVAAEAEAFFMDWDPYREDRLSAGLEA